VLCNGKAHTSHGGDAAMFGASEVVSLNNGKAHTSHGGDAAMFGASEVVSLNNGKAHTSHGGDAAMFGASEVVSLNNGEAVHTIPFIILLEGSKEGEGGSVPGFGAWAGFFFLGKK
jgi:hypothetical protein